MLWRRTQKCWTYGFVKKFGLFLIIMLMLIGTAGCKKVSGSLETNKGLKQTYEELDGAGELGTLTASKKIVEYLGTLGYAAVDADNQVDMVNAGEMLEFINQVTNQEDGQVEVFAVGSDGSLTRYRMETMAGDVNITRNYYVWNDGILQVNVEESYSAYTWNYSEEGYLFFEKYYPSGFDGPSGHVALRVEPLDEKCRELNRLYIQPVGYRFSNMFSTDWNEDNFGGLDFYDVFDKFYEKVYNRIFPYTTPDNGGEGTIYKVTKEEFERVIMSYFDIGSEELQSRTKYLEVEQKYEYRPRGLYDSEQPNTPYPEVVNYKENDDGTITMEVNVVYAHKNTAKVYAHEVMVRLFCDGRFQYVSNHIIPSEDNGEASWHSDRLTEGEWLEVYGRFQAE